MMKETLAVAALALLCWRPCSGASNMGCQEVRYAYSAKGINVYDVPLTPQSGVELQICPQGPTCCTRAMETRLGKWSSAQYKKALDKRTDQMAAPFKAKATQVDGFMMNLFTDSQRQFHRVFTQTYGVLYERNARLFKEYFYQLKRFFLYGKVNLHESTATFFSSLYQKMFQVMNSQYRFDQTYMTCVAANMEEAAPFGEVPRKMASAVKRSLVAIRSLSQALKSSFQISEDMKDVEASQECLKAVQKMNSCPACQGFPGLRPCNHYCVDVMKACLEHHIQTQNLWDKFIDSMMTLSDRLAGPFNVEMIIHPLDISISDAIMTFQESGFKVTQKVFEKCGTPRLVKRSAEIDEGEFAFDDATSTAGAQSPKNTDAAPIEQQQQPAHVRPLVQASSVKTTEFEKLVADLRRVVRSSQGFWRHLPFAMCARGGRKDSLFDDEDDRGKLSISEVSRGQAKDKLCWNGQDSVPEEAGDDADEAKSVTGLKSLAETPFVVKEQMRQLEEITEQLIQAQRGAEVVWWNPSEDILESGSGFSSEDSYDDDDGSGAVAGIGVTDDEDYFEGGSGDDSQLTIEEGSGDRDEEAWGGTKEEGPWVPWQKSTTTTTTTSTQTPDDSLNEIDDRRPVVKTSGGAGLMVRMGHRWDVAVTVARILLPGLACYLASAITGSSHLRV